MSAAPPGDMLSDSNCLHKSLSTPSFNDSPSVIFGLVPEISSFTFSARSFPTLLIIHVSSKVDIMCNKRRCTAKWGDTISGAFARTGSRSDAEEMVSSHFTAL